MTIEKNILEVKVSTDGNGTHTNVRTNGTLPELIEATMKMLSGIYSGINDANPEVAKDFRTFFTDKEALDVTFTIDEEEQEKKMANVVNKRKKDSVELLKKLLEEMMEDED